MTADSRQRPDWNDETRISCEFVFKCPQAWDRLQPTPDDRIRHCPECQRDVYLARSEEEFRRYAKEGQCVAVRGIGPESLTVGRVEAPYGVPLTRS